MRFHDNERCDGCRYFTTSMTAEPGLGSCVKNPPVIFPYYAQLKFDDIGCWPLVRVEQWCGAYAEGAPAKGENDE